MYMSVADPGGVQGCKGTPLLARIHTAASSQKRCVANKRACVRYTNRLVLATNHCPQAFLLSANLRYGFRVSVKVLSQLQGV